MKRAAFHVGNAARCDNPDSPGGGQDELVHIGAGKALFDAIPHNSIAIEAKKPVGSPDPDEAVQVLQDAGWSQRTQAEVFADALKNVVRSVGKRKWGRLGGPCLCSKATEY